MATEKANGATPQIKTISTIQLPTQTAATDMTGQSTTSFNEFSATATRLTKDRSNAIEIVNHPNCDSSLEKKKPNLSGPAPNVIIQANGRDKVYTCSKQPKETFTSATSNAIEPISNVLLDKTDGLIWIDQHPNHERTKREATRFNLDELDHFLCQINPIDKINWRQSSLLVKIMCLLRAPLLLISILTIPVVDQEKPQSNWCRLLNSIHCFTVPIAVVALTSLKWGSEPWWWFSSTQTLADRQLQEDDQVGRILSSNLAGRNASEILGGVGRGNRLAVDDVGDDTLRSCAKFLVFLPGLMLAIYVFNTTGAARPPRYHPVYAYFGFIMSVIWIYKLANEIISLLKTVGIILSMSDTAIGLGFLAWGNSLGDIVANLTLAQAGYARMALGASIGAPLLNLLLGFGLSFTFSLKPGDLAPINYNDTMTLLAGTLALVLILLMTSTLLAPNRSKKLFGYLLIACYGLYFTLAVCLEYDLL